jgi:DNA-directed RNA polymerase subunit F
MPKEIISKKPVSFPEVVTIFNNRKKEDELNYLQRIALEHAQSSSKTTSSKSKKIVKTLISQFELPEMIAISIANFYPETVDELRIFLQDASRVYSTEELFSILDILAAEK